MSSTTPNIGLTLPIGTEKVSRQIINQNMTKIDTAVGKILTYSFTNAFANQSALESALVNLGDSMGYLEVKNIRFSFSPAPSSGVFNGRAGFWFGTIKRSSSGRYCVEVQENSNSTRTSAIVTGSYSTANGWVWDAPSDDIDALNSTLAVKTGTFTADSTNHPNGDPHFTVKQYGKVVSINGYMRYLGSFNADTNFRLGTISGVSMPPTDVRGIATIASQAYLNGSYNYLSISPLTGDVNINPSEATNGKAVYFTICYVTD